ncbi:MAG: hypothetical protein QUS13_07190 [Smithella sp.]|nr:hypothetical protein [Smithella sp.]
MIAKLKKEEKIEQEIIRKKLERLSILTSQFLERSFSYETLVKDRQEMERLKMVLLDNLWAGNINPDDRNWCPKTNEEFATMIIYFHRLMTEGFWNNFKQELQFTKALKVPVVVPPEYEGLESEPMENIDPFIKIEIPDTHMTVRFIRNSDKVEFMRDSVDAIPALLDLLQDLPLDNLRFCGNTECRKFIVKTTGKDRIFCNGKCQSKQYQREFRETSPEEHKKYHRNYYQQVKKMEKRKKEKNEQNEGKEDEKI